jgi:hypothetical protein
MFIDGKVVCEFQAKEAISLLAGLGFAVAALALGFTCSHHPLLSDLPAVSVQHLTTIRREQC